MQRNDQIKFLNNPKNVDKTKGFASVLGGAKGGSVVSSSVLLSKLIFCFVRYCLSYSGVATIDEVYMHDKPLTFANVTLLVTVRTSWNLFH